MWYRALKLRDRLESTFFEPHNLGPLPRGSLFKYVGDTCVVLWTTEPTYLDKQAYSQIQGEVEIPENVEQNEFGFVATYPDVWHSTYWLTNDSDSIYITGSPEAAKRELSRWYVLEFCKRAEAEIG